MRVFDFVTVDVFTERRFGGNPLAVFPDARGMTDAEMQALAAEFNLSETTFVLPAENKAHTARVRIFTKTYEMPFAGHPNVGTGWVLGRQGRDLAGVLLCEEIAGLVRIDLARDALGEVRGATVAAPRPFTRAAELPAAEAARALGIAPAEVLTARHAPVVGSVGNPFLIAEVAGEALGRMAPDATAMARAAAAAGMEGRAAFYAYAREGAEIRARMFALIGGLLEDPATGSAATALAPLLLSLDGGAAAAYRIRQGEEMGRPSLLQARAWREADGLRGSVGGNCVPVLQGTVTL